MYDGASYDALYDALECDGEVEMRTTVTLDDTLVGKALDLAGDQSTSSLVNLGLESLIRAESARRLAALGGSDPSAQAGERRRDADRRDGAAQ